MVSALGSVLMWASLALAASSTSAASPYDGWKPHKYCNSLDHIDETKIQPLTQDQQQRVESLELVQIIARHGARVPYYRLFCWDVKQNNPMNAYWTCPPTMVSSQDIGLDPSTGYGRLYAKSYLKGHNILSGNCTVGGLLPLGRQQHLRNGEFLREAYIGDGPLKLFPHTDLSQFPSSDFFLRSDDEERTIGSGQALMDGFFPIDPQAAVANPLGNMLTWTVADKATDYIDVNEKICPLLGMIANESTGSETFQKHLHSNESVHLEKNFEQIVGNFSWDSVLECLSVARCNDMPLPNGIDEQVFTNVFEEVEVRQSLFLTYNNSWYAKNAMQPLMQDISKALHNAINGKPNAPRLLVTMSHDSTIMPLLASILQTNWDRKWTPYAGMVVFELYKLKAPSSFGIRVVVNGEPKMVPGCDDTLCEATRFFNLVSFGDHPRDCFLPDQTQDATIERKLPSRLNATWDRGNVASSLTNKLFSTRNTVVVVVVVVGVMAAVLGYARMRRRYSAERRALLG